MLNKNIKMAIFLLSAGFLFFASSAWATRIEIPSSPNPVGSGARALGMGGAFIAVADDATAASWNPGGLIQLDYPEMSAVFGYVHRNENNAFGKYPETDGSTRFDYSHLNYLSVAYPFEWGEQRRNMIVSLNYQQMYDFNHGWHYSLTENTGTFIQSDYEQEGALYALGLAYCVQLNINFSLGVTLNWWGDFLSENRWEQTYRKEWVFSDSESYLSNKKEVYEFDGLNANIGFLWRLSEHWTVGGVFKTPFAADIRRRVTGMEIENYLENQIDETHDETLDMPMSYGIGAAYRHSDSFTVSADIYRTHWDKFELEDDEGNRISPVTGKDMDESDIGPTTWFRAGAEYLHIGEKWIIPFRIGIFYDPAPAEGSPDDYYGFSFGTGLLYEPKEKGLYERIVFDAAYQFRFGNDVGEHFLKDLGFSQDIREHTVYASVIVHF